MEQLQIEPKPKSRREYSLITDDVKFMKLAHVPKFFPVSSQTVRNWSKLKGERKLPLYRIDGVVMVKPSVLWDYIDKHKTEIEE